MEIARVLTFSTILASLTLAGPACATEGAGSTKPSAAPQATATAATTATKTIAYYFHGTARCRTCRTIESYADEAIKSAFASELAGGHLAWQPVNIDEPKNEHFIGDYQLFTRSLVLVDGSNPKRFKNLDKVWQLVGDKPAFVRYVQDEVRAFRKTL